MLHNPHGATDRRLRTSDLEALANGLNPMFSYGQPHSVFEPKLDESVAAPETFWAKAVRWSVIAALLGLIASGIVLGAAYEPTPSTPAHAID